MEGTKRFTGCLLACSALVMAVISALPDSLQLLWFLLLRDLSLLNQSFSTFFSLQSFWSSTSTVPCSLLWCCWFLMRHQLTKRCWEFLPSQSVLTDRARTYWLIELSPDGWWDVIWGGDCSCFVLFSFFNYCFALDKSCHKAILGLCWVAWQVNPLVVQRDSETVAAVLAGLTRKCILNVLVTDLG